MLLLGCRLFLGYGLVLGYGLFGCRLFLGYGLFGYWFFCRLFLSCRLFCFYFYLFCGSGFCFCLGFLFCGFFLFRFFCFSSSFLFCLLSEFLFFSLYKCFLSLSTACIGFARLGFPCFSPLLQRSFNLFFRFAPSHQMHLIEDSLFLEDIADGITWLCTNFEPVNHALFIIGEFFVFTDVIITANSFNNSSVAGCPAVSHHDVVEGSSFPSSSL